MTIQSIRKKSIGEKPPEVADNREYREGWPELRVNMRKQIPVTGNITIAIVDSGNPWSNAQDRDDDGHATLIDRMIRARAERSPGLKITILHFKAFSAQGWPGPKRCAAAITKAAEKEPGVIVLAWDVGHTTEELEAAIFAVRDTAVVVIAAGNWSLDNDTHPNWPANYGGPTGMEHVGGPTGMKHVITVMATDEEDERASFSSYGESSVDIAAPGFANVKVQPPQKGNAPHSASTLRSFGSLKDSYSAFRGTSAATAHVALLAALVRVKYGLSPTDTKSRICKEFRDVPELRERRIPIGRLKKLCATAAVADFDEALK